MSRLKFVKQRIEEPETEMVIELAHAGMSYACIAREVWGEEGPSAVQRVGFILSWEGVRVRDYRNGRNQLGKTMIAAIRRGANLIGHIKAASVKAAAKVA